MKRFPETLTKKLLNRTQKGLLRQLPLQINSIDFSSNDYLGFAKSQEIFELSHQYLVAEKQVLNGATGSRLISGNHKLYEIVENQIAKIHQSESAVLFNSGYDANIGFFSSVPQRGDIILFDELIHASIRDGIKMSAAKSYKFYHNNAAHLEELLRRNEKVKEENTIYVVTESVFSMDGDSPDLGSLSEIVSKHEAFLVVDEAHALGVLGNNYLGLSDDKSVFARIITFGKALGAHGAAVLCSDKLKQYLINFARSFIYTTGLPPHSLATIAMSYQLLEKSEESKRLQENIQFFKKELKRLDLTVKFINSNSAIHCCIISGNEEVKKVTDQLQKEGFDVKPILSPTVPENQERIRFCLHSYNSYQEITQVLELLSTFVNQ